MPNIVSPKPERMERKIGAAVKLAGDILSGRKKPSEALREYKAAADNIKREKEMDKWRQY